MSEDIEKYKKLAIKLKPKYFIEQLVALVLIIVALPLYLLLAFLILMDGVFHSENAGSIFYQEKRISGGKIFNIFKFRTVTEKAISMIRASNGTKSITASEGRTWAGDIILRWYLDELPQLFNIARGEMSFVGPRPHVPAHHDSDIQEGMIYRNYIKAGLLGVPQACKRHPKYQAIFKRMARRQKSESQALNTLDGVYIKKCLDNSLIKICLLDISIICRGLLVVLRGGATV